MVAALLIHIERNAVGSIKPNIRKTGFVPANKRALRAILLCRPQLSTARAIIRLPMYIIWMPYNKEMDFLLYFGGFLCEMFKAAARGRYSNKDKTRI